MTEPNNFSPPPPMDRKEAKAQAAAAKAYSKSQRNWFMRHKILSALAAIIVIIIAVSASGSGSTDNNNAADTTSETTTSSSTPKTTTGKKAPSTVKGSGPTATLPIQDGDWRLDSLRLKDDGIGDFGGTARITYTGDDQDGGDNIFTVTVFKGGKDIAVLQGSARTVLPGTTATVQLISQDKFVAGPWQYDFQNDL